MYNVDSVKPDGCDEHAFSTQVKVRYYLYSQPLVGPPHIGYYICECDNVVGLYNKHGDFLYEVGSMDPAQVSARIEERSFTNFKLYGKGSRLPGARSLHKSQSWSQECITKCGGSIVIYLTKLHPNRTYGECEFIMNNEGYRIVNGFLEPDTTKRQL